MAQWGCHLVECLTHFFLQWNPGKLPAAVFSQLNTRLSMEALLEALMNVLSSSGASLLNLLRRDLSSAISHRFSLSEIICGCDLACGIMFSWVWKTRHTQTYPFWELSEELVCTLVCLSITAAERCLLGSLKMFLSLISSSIDRQGLVWPPDRPPPPLLHYSCSSSCLGGVVGLTQTC